MEDSQSESKSLGSTDESDCPTAGKAAGRVDLQYTSAGGRSEMWSLIRFCLDTKYDARSRTWRSDGYADSSTRRYVMNVTYDESSRTLTINLQNRVFTVPGTHMQASNYDNRSTLNISFLNDAEGSADAPGDRYIIKRTSRLDLSL